MGLLYRANNTDCDGLSIRISVHARLTFQYRDRYQNKATGKALGRYPDIALKEAREKITEL